MLQLWHCIDARSFRALWAMEELGLDYDLRVLPFPPRAFDKSYFAENPLATVPLLVDGETRMTESAAMLEYLARRHGGGRLSVGPEEPGYGAYLNWLHHGEATLTFPQTLVLRYAMFEPKERRVPQVAEDYALWFHKRLALADEALSDGRATLLPQGFTMADISVAYAVMLARYARIEEGVPQRLRDWNAALEERPAFKAAKQAQAEAAERVGLSPSLF